MILNCLLNSMRLNVIYLHVAAALLTAGVDIPRTSLCYFFALINVLLLIPVIDSTSLYVRPSVRSSIACCN